MAKKKISDLVPSKVRIKRDVDYEVVTIDNFQDNHQLGECRPNERQIVIKKDQSNTEYFKTFLHEVLHAIDLESDLKLTEKQVRKLEDEIFRVLKLNNVIEKLLK